MNPMKFLAVLLLASVATPALAGAPAPAVEITLTQIPDGVVRTVPVAADSTVSFTGLPAGRYVLYSIQKGAREVMTDTDVENQAARQKKWMSANFRIDIARAPQGTKLSDCGTEPTLKTPCQWILEVATPGDVAFATTVKGTKSNTSD